jgi:hypothetical protein
MNTVTTEVLVAEEIPALTSARGWRRALLASALLHLLLLALMLSLRPDTSSSLPRQTPPYHVSVVLLRNPRLAEPVQQTTTSAPDQAESFLPAQPAGTAAPEPPLPAAPSTTALTEPAPAITVTGVTPQAPAVPGADAIRAAIVEFSESYKAGLTADWLSQCVRYRERYPTQDCPQQRAQDNSALDDGQRIAEAVFAGVTRDERYARLTSSLLQQNEELDELMEEGGVLGALARDRYYLNREYVFFLNGNFNFQSWNFVKTANAGNGNLEFMRGFMQFQCKESPCIYEFTGMGEKSAGVNEGDGEDRNTNLARP